MQGALANRLQRRTYFKTQNGLRGLERGPTLAVLPNGPIFSDFGPESDFFEQNGPELVRINTQKSGLGGNKQRQINNVLYLRDMDRSAVSHRACQMLKVLY